MRQFEDWCNVISEIKVHPLTARRQKVILGIISYHGPFEAVVFFIGLVVTCRPFSVLDATLT